ncbi:MAG TPA: SPOR domain-containing protein [Methylomirabilota bacterium]|nr:SPOR domain-containing protein [Methylomirabilota bacterium]
MAARPRPRGRSEPGTGQWIALGAAVVVILALTFLLGLLVGRHWARQDPAPTAADPAKKSAQARRGGLAEAVDRPEMPEKLTFYQTLTAPLSALPSSAPSAKATPTPRGEPAPKPEAAPKSEPAAKPDPAPNGEPARKPATTAAPPAASPAAPAPAWTPDMREAAATAPEPAHPAAAPPAPKAEAQTSAKGSLTLQVGAFKGRSQAEALQKQLAAAGFDAYVAEIGPDAGQARYRVRVGQFKTREDAQRVAARLRSERSLQAFITAR